jgi:mannosyltransferase OCH1-like enzyme
MILIIYLIIILIVLNIINITLKHKQHFNNINTNIEQTVTIDIKKKVKFDNIFLDGNNTTTIIENYSDFSNHPIIFENIPKSYESQLENIVGIPKIIHHICPRDFKRWNILWFSGYESWLRIFPKPEYTHMIWYDDELDKFIEKEYPWFLDVFKSYDINIKRIDMIRPFFLYHYGGIYADMDYMVYKNFYNEIPQDKISIPESPYKYNEHIQNALMISPPKNIFWLLLIDECYKHRDKHVFEASGPQLMTSMYYKHSHLINVLPLELYNPDIKDSDAFNATNLYAKHLLSTSWG